MPIDVIYSSPLKRAYRTAEAVSYTHLSPETVEFIQEKAKKADAHVYVAAAITKGLKSGELCDLSLIHI